MYVVLGVWFVERRVDLWLDEELLERVDFLVKSGIFKSRTEAFKVALLMLVDKYYGVVLRERLERIQEGTEGYPDLTGIVVEVHEEE